MQPCTSGAFYKLIIGSTLAFRLMEHPLNGRRDSPHSIIFDFQKQKRHRPTWKLQDAVALCCHYNFRDFNVKKITMTIFYSWYSCATVHWAFLAVGIAWKQRAHIYDFEKRRFVYRIYCLWAC